MCLVRHSGVSVAEHCALKSGDVRVRVRVLFGPPSHPGVAVCACWPAWRRSGAQMKFP